MAKVIADDTDPRYVGGPYPWLYVLITGILIGAFVWGSTLLLERYVIDPLACRASTILDCGRSFEIAAGVATVVGAILGIGGLIRVNVYRPLIVAVATLAILWSLPMWVQCLSWPEALAWSAGLYALGYMLFGWLMRYVRLFPVLIVSVILVIAAQLILTR